MAELMNRNQRSGLATGNPLGDWLGLDPFRNFFSNAASSAVGFEVARTDRGYNVEVPVAGFKPDEINVSIEDRVLSIQGKSEKRQFTRSLLIPDEIDPESVKAKVAHGLLTLELSVHPKAQPKKINIETAE